MVILNDNFKNSSLSSSYSHYVKSEYFKKWCWTKIGPTDRSYSQSKSYQYNTSENN